MDQMFSDFTRTKSSLAGLGLTDTEIEAKLKDLTPTQIENKLKLETTSELQKEGMEPEEIKKELPAILRERLPDALKDKQSDDFKEVWGEFDKHIEKTFGDRKYFVSVEEERMQKTGWRKMKFIPKEPSGPGSTPTPGSTTMGTPPPKGAYKVTPRPKGTPKTSKRIPKGAHKTSPEKKEQRQK
jgi:uncharacterized protein (DUF433 family)